MSITDEELREWRLFAESAEENEEYGFDSRILRLLDEVERLRAEVEREELLEKLNAQIEIGNFLKDKGVKRDAALALAHGALRRYGTHEPACASHDKRECICGLQAALSQPAMQRAVDMWDVRGSGLDALLDVVLAGECSCDQEAIALGGADPCAYCVAIHVKGDLERLEAQKP